MNHSRTLDEQSEVECSSLSTGDRSRVDRPARIARKRVPPLPTEQDLFNVAGNNEVVYFILCNGMIKIGTTTGLRRRLYTIRTSCPLPVRLVGVVYGGAALEASYHRQFEHLHSQGEWYRLTGELERTIRRDGYWPLGRRFTREGVDALSVTQG